MIDDTPEIEHSAFSGKVSRDGETVDVQIYRIAGAEGGWSLEVVDTDGGSTVWDDLFATDEAAFREFEDTLKTEGIGSFRAAAATDTVH